MPDWAQEIIHNVPRLVAVLGLYPACFMVFAWVEDRLSVSVKQEITAWLKSAGDFAAHHTLSFNLLRFSQPVVWRQATFFGVKCLVENYIVFVKLIFVSISPIYYYDFTISTKTSFYSWHRRNER